VYQKFPISPGDRAAMGDLISRLRGGSLDGLNVTIPHKEAVIEFLDVLTATARAVGAVNTIFHREGGLWGDNTDVAGFLADLAALSPVVDRPALVLGAGGAARAVAYGLAGRGWEVLLAARRIEQATQVVQALVPMLQAGHEATATPAAQIRAIPLEPAALQEAAPDCGLVVNATPVGMDPHPEATPWPSGVALPGRAVVYDLVYNPTETTLVRAARAAGLRARSGMGMLVEQAALAFERWTGRPANRKAMFAALPADM
jgi:shikimate dehydrogenase